MRELLVTVVLPTHNRAHCIGTALTSVLTQTYANLEAIVVDDASTDHTDEMVAAIRDSRIRYVRTDERAGAAAARNRGIDLARGELIFFQDSDDIWLPQKVARQLQDYLELASRHADVVGGFCRYVRIGDRTSAVVPPDGDLARREGRYHEVILNHNIIGTPTLMARTDVLRALGGFDTSLDTEEDWDLALRLADGRRLAFTDSVLVCCASSIGGVSQRLRAPSILRILEKHRDAFARHRLSHSVQLGAAAADYFKHSRPVEGTAVARKALRVRPTLKCLLLALSPGSYRVLRELKERLSGSAHVL